MQGFRRFTTKMSGSSVGPQNRDRWFAELTLSWDDVVAKSIGSWHRRCTEFAGFAAVHHKTVRYMVEPQNHDRRLDGQRRDPGVPRSFEASGTWHDRGACVGKTRRSGGYATVRWRTSCGDKNAPVRACVVTPRVGTLQSFSECLYIGGVAKCHPTLWLGGGSALSF
jgi:hypothetical protein